MTGTQIYSTIFVTASWRWI